MPPSRLQPLYPNRRRRSPGRFVLPILLILLIGFIFYLSTIDTEVPVTRMEQDVTDALPKG
jgi:CHASE3 domain sensor protein